MALQVDQELRRDLLLKALEACSDPDEALEIAVRMECFILEGQNSSNKGFRAPQEKGTAQPQEKKKAHTRPRWTTDDDKHLRHLWQEKLTVEAIAEQLNRTPASIYGRARQLGLSPNERENTKSSRKTDNAGSAAQPSKMN